MGGVRDHGWKDGKSERLASIPPPLVIRIPGHTPTCANRVCHITRHTRSATPPRGSGARHGSSYLIPATTPPQADRSTLPSAGSSRPCYHVKARRLAGPGRDHQHNLAMSELYTLDLQHDDIAEWLNSPYEKKTFAIVTEFFSDRLPVNATLGFPCRHGHSWNSTPWCTRRKGRCVECQRAIKKANYEKNKEAVKAKRKNQYYSDLRPPVTEKQKQANIQYKKNKRQQLKEEGLNSRGKPFYQTPLAKAIKNAGKLPTVLDLLKAEQEAYWRKHPEEKHAEQKRCYSHRRKLRYLTQPLLRIYSKEKSKRRKTAMKGGHKAQITPKEIRDRFACFGHTCAYCGNHGDLHIEHFIPISRGGSHVLGNILPACPPCNYSKATHDPSAWYQSQPFFTNQRWRRILLVLGKTRGAVEQLPLL